MKRSWLFLISSCIIIISSCNISRKTTAGAQATISRLELVNEYDLPGNWQFKGTTVGGLSSIDYDAANELYYMISDDRSDKNPARLYTAKIGINSNGIDTVIFQDVITWKDKNGNTYPSKATDPVHTPDPESMRYDASRREFVWSSEGERIVLPGKTVLEDPSVYITDLNGRFKDSFQLPHNMHMSVEEKGPRQNSVFEGTAFSDDHNYLFVSVEEPLYEDGPRAGSGDSTAWVRWIKFDVATRKPVAQYAYQLDPVAYPANPPGAFKVNGISEIMHVAGDQFIVIERSFSTGHLSNTIRIYLANAKGAADISSTRSIHDLLAVAPISKKLLLNMDDLGRYIDNVEGVSFGPVLPDGHRSLVFIVDNNFDSKEKAQVFLFRVIP